MRVPFSTAAVGLALASSGCKTASDDAVKNPTPKLETAAPPQGVKTATGEQAIAVAVADRRADGGDPANSEWSAKWLGEYWHVMAWRIMYPENTGGSRFVPGGYVTYRVSADGRVMATYPGY